jgi:hypothetical protein
MGRKINDDYLRNKIQFLRNSAEKHRDDTRPGRKRFGVYRYLQDIYAVYLEFHSRRISKQATRRIFKRMGLAIRKNSHPIKILIEASAPNEDPKQKSRWTAALRFAFGWHLPAIKLKWCFNKNGGISGCASKYAINRGTTRQKKLSENDGSSELSGVKCASKVVV